MAQHPPRHRTLINLAVLSACGAFSAHAFAQQAAPAAPAAPATAASAPAPAPAVELEKVVVTGIRASLAKAAELKRQAAGVRDSIVAEDIGKLPEQNIADALAMLPGIEVIRDPISNEGQSVRLRGLGVNQTITSVNGAMVRTTSTGKIGGGFREFSYDVLPSELFNRVDVYKTPMAELQEGGIGGNVDLQTRRPFDNKGFQNRFAITAVNNTNDGKNNPRGNFFISNTWGNFGALISVAASRANNGNAGAFNSVGQWVTNEYGPTANNGNRVVWNTTTPSGTGGLTLAQLNSGFLPRLIRVFSQESERKRIGVSTSLQFKNQDVDISYDMLYAKLNDDVKDNFVQWSIGNSATAVPPPAGSPPNTPPTFPRALVPVRLTLDANNIINGTIGNLVQDNFSRTFLNESKFQYHGINSRFTVSDTRRVKAQLSYAQGDAWRNDSLITANGDTTTNARQTLDVNFSDPLEPRIKSSASLLDKNVLTAFSYGGGYRTEKDRQGFLNLVGEQDWNLGSVDGTFKLGYNFAQSTKGVTNYNSLNVLNNYQIPGLNKTYAQATPAERIAFMQPFLVPNDARAVARTAAPGVPSEWLVFNRDFIYGTLGALEQNKASPIVPNTSYESTERTYALFLQTDLETQVFDRKLKANIGVRAVETETSSDTVTQARGGGWSPINPRSNYTDILPAASLSYDITRQLVARAAYGETITRGPVNRIAGAVRIPNNAILAVEFGNPGLLPEKSKGTDWALEYYPNRSSVAGVNYFERKISGSVQTTTSNQPFNTLGLDPLLWQPTQAGQLAATPTTPIAVTTFTNNPNPYTIKGFEFQFSQTFSFLPAPFDGFGATASFNKVDIAGRTKPINVSSRDASGNIVRDANGNIVFTPIQVNMPNLPPKTMALALFYEKGPFSARVSYTHRDAYANDGSNDSNGVGFQRWLNDRAYVNLSAGYKVYRDFELRFDVINLTKTEAFEYFKNYDANLAAQRGNDESRIESGFKAGRTYQVTLRGKF